jgi:hypothetical protein
MQLRSFSAYGQTAPYVVSAQACNLANLDGNAAAAGYLQIFNLAAAASLSTGVTVPLKSFTVSAAGPLASIFSTLGPILLSNGCIVAMSSTETVYTAVATAFDVFGEIDEFEVDVTTGCSVAGDLSTPQTTLSVWSSTTAKRIYKATVTELLGSKRFFCLITQKGSTISTAVLEPVAANATVTLNFGSGGFMPPLFNKSAAANTSCIAANFDANADGSLASTTGTNALYIKVWYL